jgi:hypothetical protein
MHLDATWPPGHNRDLPSPRIRPLPEHSSSSSPVASSDERSHGRIEETITRLENVAGARIIGGPGNRLDALDVTAAPGWPVETVRRDVQALLQQRFDLEVPARFVLVRASEATVGQDDEQPREPAPAAAPAPEQDATAATGAARPSQRQEPISGTAPAVAGAAAAEDPPDCSRLVLDTVHLALRAQGTSVGVDLLDGEKRLRGTAGPVGPDGLLAGVVDATAHALRARMPHDLSTVAAEVVAAGGDEIAIVTLHASDGRSRQRVTGSAIVRGSVEDAMARATLDATNRLLGGTLKRRGLPSYERSAG